jgi:hypothetical protein
MENYFIDNPIYSQWRTYEGGSGSKPPRTKKKNCDIIDEFLIINHPCIHELTS